MRGVELFMLKMRKMARKPGNRFWRDDTVPGCLEIKAGEGEPLVKMGIAGSGKTGPLFQGFPVDLSEAADKERLELPVGKRAEKVMLEKGHGEFPDKRFY